MRGLTAARGGYDVHAEHRARHGQPQNRDTRAFRVSERRVEAEETKY